MSFFVLLFFYQFICNLGVHLCIIFQVCSRGFSDDYKGYMNFLFLFYFYLFILNKYINRPKQNLFIYLFIYLFHLFIYLFLRKACLFIYYLVLIVSDLKIGFFLV